MGVSNSFVHGERRTVQTGMVTCLSALRCHSQQQRCGHTGSQDMAHLRSHQRCSAGCAATAICGAPIAHNSQARGPDDCPQSFRRLPTIIDFQTTIVGNRIGQNDCPQSSTIVYNRPLPKIGVTCTLLALLFYTFVLGLMV